jgi:DNA-binding XRE family transcriptional regulator
MSKNRKAKRRNRATSERERQRRSEQARLLYRRDEVAHMLGLSMSTIIRMEADGRLPGLKMRPGKNCRALYRASDVHRLAGVEGA